MKHLSGKEILDLLAAGERTQAQREHLCVCENCRARWEQFEKTWQLLGRWDVEATAPDLLERILRAAARERRQYSRWNRWRLIARAAGIVILIAGAGVTAGRLSQFLAPESLGQNVASIDAERALYLDLFGTEPLGLNNLSLLEQLEPRP